MNERPLTCDDHTPSPSGYVAWHEWAERKAKTHNQLQCPTCGTWAIWKPKAALRETDDD